MTTVDPVVVLPPRFTFIDRAEAADDGPRRPPRVLLVAEGTYPFEWGGVSTWCDGLVRSLPHVDFSVLAVAPQPGLTPVFERLPNIVEIAAVPLWNVRDVKESWPKLGIRELHGSRARTTDEEVVAEFLPPVRRFLGAVLSPEPTDPGLAGDIHAIYRFLSTRDLHRTLQHDAVWAMFVDEARQAYQLLDERLDLPELKLWELTTGFQWLARWLFPLAKPLPEVDVVHAAMAGVCSMAAIAAKLEHGTGFLLTEHGVYLRERYLAEAGREDSAFLKLLGLGFARRITELSYQLADQISPCCDYNQRWEVEAGADPFSLETIYYGVDSPEAAGEPQPDADRTRPCVVWVGRINPLKDVETLLRSAALVAHQRPDVVFKLFGSAPAADADYHQRCLALHEELGLADIVEFCGYTDDPAKAYLQGDVVVLSSVSEGFPFSTLEAMLCGRPIVATAVGGIPEQIEGAGIAVEPRNPQAMAEGILALVNDPERRLALGVAAKERATGLFTTAKFRGAHYSSYLRLSPAHGHWQAAGRIPPPLSSALEAADAQPAPGTAVEELTDQVRSRTRYPIDHLEVAAVIESVGVTDAVAAERYGFPNTFRLADALLGTVRDERPSGGEGKPQLPVNLTAAAARQRSHLDTARRPILALLPSIALLTAIWALTVGGARTSERVLALTIGMTAGMLFTNGVALAIGPRASTLVSLSKVDSARRFLIGCLAVGVVLTAVMTLLVVLPGWSALAFFAHERTTFLLAALALSVIWMLAASLSIVAVSGWTGVGLTCGVIVGIGLDRALTPITSAHLGLGTAAGFVVVVTVMAVALDHALRRGAEGRPSTDRTLPSIGFMALEGLPYFVYGTLGVLMFVSVHVIGWADLGPTNPQVTTLELGLFLPLAPAVLGLGVAERSIRHFWVAARDLQAELPAEQPARFGAGLDAVYRGELRGYLESLLTLSALTIVVVEILIRTPALTRIAPQAEAADLRILYLSGLLAYLLLAWAQFNSSFSLSLGQWRGPLGNVLVGAVVAVSAGLILVTTVGYQALGFGLAAGAGIYGLLSLRSTRRVFATADHCYVSATT